MKLKCMTPEFNTFFFYKHSATKIDNIKYGYVQESSLVELESKTMKQHYNRRKVWWIGLKGLKRRHFRLYHDEGN